jgi:hypothetical protein
MTWSEIPFHPTTKALRQFSAGWLLFWLAFGVHQYAVHHHTWAGLALMGIAVVIGTPGLLKPALVRWLFVGWMILAFPIGWLISELMLLVMFYGILTPTAALFRWRGRDLLQCRPRPTATTFWQPKPMPEDVRSYFRQY